MNEQLKIKVKTYYEVHTSEDGEKWYASRMLKSQYDDTPAGRREAEKAATVARQTNRLVRLVHITRKTKPLKFLENKAILSKQQIADLLLKGKAALAGVPGVSVNESSSIGFGSNDIVMGPTRVSVTFYASMVLGKIPLLPKKGEAPDMSDAALAARRKWNEDSAKLTVETYNVCIEKLTAAGIKFHQRSGDIVLLP
jgi:hypothetical protein